MSLFSSKPKNRSAAPSRRDKNTQEIADLLNLNRATVLRWASEGLPHDQIDRKTGNRYNVAEVQTWMKINHRSGVIGRPMDEGSEQLKALRIRRENALVLKYERENKIEAGKLIDAAEEERRDVQKLVVLRSRLCGLGATISPQLEGLSGADRHSLIDRYIENTLNDLAKPGVI